jgi:hypothetical protein
MYAPTAGWRPGEQNALLAQQISKKHADIKVLNSATIPADLRVFVEQAQGGSGYPDRGICLPCLLVYIQHATIETA